VLLLGREHALYRDVESILVYPSTVVSPPRPRGFFEVSVVPVADGGTAIHGEAHLGGPVILAWDNVLAGARAGAVRNVVFHEFAHKIDMLDGEVDGTPPLDSTPERRRWAEVCSRAFLELRERRPPVVPRRLRGDQRGRVLRRRDRGVLPAPRRAAPP
jgi:Mlc titration factor MtfA (ptsG expression regulator)